MIGFPERFNMADYFLYHNLEEGRESKVCLYFKDQTYTYGDAAGMSSRVGNALRAAGVLAEIERVQVDQHQFVFGYELAEIHR